MTCSIRVGDLIGVPYKPNGRNLDGFDCYGLAIEIEKRYGHKLNDVVYTDNHNAELDNEFAPTLNVEQVHEIKESYILEFIINNTLHIGVALNNYDFIHCKHLGGVCISKIAAYPLNKIYRIKD